jgi:hypothetical protein
MDDLAKPRPLVEAAPHVSAVKGAEVNRYATGQP